MNHIICCKIGKENTEAIVYATSVCLDNLDSTFLPCRPRSYYRIISVSFDSYSDMRKNWLTSPSNNEVIQSSMIQKSLLQTWRVCHNDPENRAINNSWKVWTSSLVSWSKSRVNPSRMMVHWIILKMLNLRQISHWKIFQKFGNLLDTIHIQRSSDKYLVRIKDISLLIDSYKFMRESAIVQK